MATVLPSRKWTIGSLVGALAAAFLASICCIGPLVLALLGLAGAGLLVKLERYRPYFMIVTIGFLALGFYYTYRTPKVADGDACGCVRPKTNRLGRILVWLATVAVVGILGFPYLVAQKHTATIATANLQRASFQIDGMDCAACSVAIRVALEKIAGVKDATVLFDAKRATVDYDPAKVTPQQLVDAVNRLGYQASLASEKHG